LHGGQQEEEELQKNRMAVHEQALLTLCCAMINSSCFQGFGDSSMVLKSISNHAQYVTLQKYFSHPNLVLKFLFFNKKTRIIIKFCTGRAKE